MTDLNMLHLVVLNRIMSNLDGTLVVTQEWNLVAMNSIVFQCLPHPKELNTTTCRGYILGFGGGERHTILLLGRPTNQGPTKKLASPKLISYAFCISPNWNLSTQQAQSLIPLGTKGQKLGYESNIERFFSRPSNDFPLGQLGNMHTFPH
jgi:hypothetical protein